MIFQTGSALKNSAFGLIRRFFDSMSPYWENLITFVRNLGRKFGHPKMRLYLDACGTESYIYGGSSYFHPQYTQIAKNDANGNFYSTAPETDPQIYLVSQSDYPYPFSTQQK